MEEIKAQITHLWTDHKKIVIAVVVVVILIIIAF